MDKRIFVEKKADFQVKSESLVRELQHNLGLSTLKSIRIVQVYDVFDLVEDLFAPAEKHIFSEQVTDHVLDEVRVADKVAHIKVPEPAPCGKTPLNARVLPRCTSSTRRR